MEAIIAADPDLQRYREIDDRNLSPSETMVERQVYVWESEGGRVTDYANTNR